jgi:alcohol dehydrogenase YqhD (iron-dependent ADH family)
MRFAQFAVRVWNISMNFENPEQTALEGIARTEDYFRSIGMPINMRELGVTATPEEVHEMAHACTFGDQAKIGSFKPLTYADIKAILESANA